MASKKKPATGTAVVKRSIGTAVSTDVRSRLAEKAARGVERLAPIGGSNISTRNGVFSVGGEQIGQSLDLVILNHARWKAYYDRPYDPDNPTVPACFSVADSCDRETVNAMVPHETSPVPQSDNCFNCPNNQFGSALVGEGKACRDSVHLAVISFDDLEDEDPEVRVLSVPPTSSAAYNMAAMKCYKVLKTPTYGVVMRVTLVAHKAAWKMEFEVVNALEEEDLLATLDEKSEAVLEQLMQLPDVSLYEPPQPKRNAGRARVAAAPANVVNRKKVVRR